MYLYVTEECKESPVCARGFLPCFYGMHSFDRKPYDACGFLQQLCEFSDILNHDIRRYLALFDIRFLRFSAHHQNAGNRTVIRYGDIRIQTIPDNGNLVCVKTGFLNDVFQCFRLGFPKNSG